LAAQWPLIGAPDTNRFLLRRPRRLTTIGLLEASMTAKMFRINTLR